MATAGAPALTPPTLDAGAGAGAASSVGTVTTDAEGVIGGSCSGETPKPLVKQDLWHIEDRVLKNASKANGAYRPLCGAVRDALAIPDPEAIARVRAVARERCPSRDEQEINAFMRQNFSNLISRHVVRTVPRPEIVVPRFENVIETFKGVRDAATGTFVRFQAVLPTVPIRGKRDQLFTRKNDYSWLE